MADVFLSYSRLDKDAVAPVVERLQTEGFSLWWDQTLVAGEAWAEVTRAELKKARVVVALWSHASWDSRWVQAEAYAGYERRCLVSARLDDVSVEPPFNIMQTADVRTAEGLDQLAAGVRRALGAGAGPVSEIRAGVPPPRKSARRIAVMPFDNLSPDPANAFFTDGVHEQILSTLANGARGIEVISRTTMMSFRGRAASVAAIREELKCSHVLEGTVRREGDAVRLTVQLIDAASDQHLWSQDFDRTLSNTLSLQSEVASEIASQLFVKVAPRPRGAPQRPVDPRAYDLYLKARIGRQNLGAVADPMPIARETFALLGEAIAHDPTFAPAYAERATGHLWSFLSNFDTSKNALALAAADLAILERIAPDDPLTLAVRGMKAIVDQDYAAALRFFDEAEEDGLADPDLLRWKAVILMRLGRHDEGRRLFDHLIALDAGNLVLLIFVCMAEVAAKRPLDAARIVGLGLAKSPGNILWFAMKSNLKALFRGEVEERLALFNEIHRNLVAAQLDPDGFIAFYLELLIFERRYEDALAVLAASGRTSFVMVFYASLPTLGLGRFPLAVARGKINLLLGRLDAARADGDEVLAYAAASAPTKCSAWALEALRAFGCMLRRDRDEAGMRVRAALEMALALPDAVHWAAARHFAAQIFAFTGAEDEAVSLLEEAYANTPGVAPLYVVGDPAFADLLASNARYRALAERVRAEMAATQID
ncbi:MAG: TIR domain-containing protein [Pseudomonadota bacterium]